MKEYRLDLSHRKGMTFEQWSQAGFKVKKGAKSTLRNSSGQAIFTRSQVEVWADKKAICMDPHAEFDESCLAEEFGIHPDDPNFG